MKLELTQKQFKVLQKAMALYTGCAIKNDQADANECYILLKLLLGKI
jgi:hypothetical protein